MKWLWEWANSGPKWSVTIYFGIVYLYGVPILPLLDIEIKRVDR